LRKSRWFESTLLSGEDRKGAGRIRTSALEILVQRCYAIDDCAGRLRPETRRKDQTRAPAELPWLRGAHFESADSQLPLVTASGNGCLGFLCLSHIAQHYVRPRISVTIPASTTDTRLRTHQCATRQRWV